MVDIPSKQNPGLVIQNPYGKYYWDDFLGQAIFEPTNSSQGSDDSFKFLFHELMYGNGMTQWDGNPGPFITPDLSGRPQEEVDWWHKAAQAAQKKMWDTYGTLSPSAPATSSSPLAQAQQNYRESTTPQVTTPTPAPTTTPAPTPELPTTPASNQDNLIDRYLKSGGQGVPSGPYLDDTLNKNRKQSRGLGSVGGF